MLLGKISAVLTASTADFTRKIGSAKEDLKSLEKRVSGIRLNLDTRALDGTLTRMQKLKRTLEEVRRAQAAGNGPFVDTRALEDQAKAFEDIGKPLTDLKNRIEGLSTALQAGLYPALEEITSGFQDMYRQIGAGSTTFDKQKQNIDGMRLALVRLSRAASAAGDLGGLAKKLDADAVGASFYQPGAKEAMQRSLQLRAQAEALPARFRSDAFADLAVSAEKGAQRIERAAARVLKAELEIARSEAAGLAATPSMLNDRARAQQDLNAATRNQNRVNSGFERQIREGNLARIVAPGNTAAVDVLTQRLESLATQLRSINGQQFDGLIRGAAAVVRQFNAGEASARDAKRAVDALAASLSSVNTGRTLASQTRSMLFSESELRRQQIQSDFDRERAAGARGAEQRRDVNLTRERLNSEVIPRAQDLQRRAAESGDEELARRAQSLTTLSRRVNRQLDRAASQSNNGQAEEANRSIARANDLLARQLELERQISRELDEINAARRQQDMFLEASGGRGELLSQGARDAAANISVARQYRGQIADGLARSQVQAEIQRVTATVTGLQREMARVENSDLGADERVAELDRLDRAVRDSTAGLAGFVAARSGGAFSEAQVASSMERARNTAGSISTRGAAAAQLAIQQGLFAIDDLISSTGGLEYKLRAVGNNITQLGLLLGQSGLIPGLSATTGLFIGLAAVIGGQVVSTIARFAFGSEDAESKLKFLNEELKRSRDLAEENKKAFLEFADALEKAGRGAGSFSARGQIEDTLKEQRRRRQEEVDAIRGSTNRRAGDAGARIESLQKQLESASDPADRAMLRNEIAKATAEQRQARVAARESFNPRDAAASIASSRQIEATILDNLAQLESGGFGFLRPDVAQRNQARRERIATEEVASPTTARDAERLINAEIKQLTETLTRSFGFLDRQFAAYDPGVLESSDAINKIRDEIARLEEQRGKLQAQAAEEANAVIDRLLQISLAAQQNIGSSVDRVSSLGLDSTATEPLVQQFASRAKQIADAERAAQDALDKGLDASEFENSAKEASDALGELYARADELAKSVALGEIVGTPERLRAALGGIEQAGPSDFGSRLAQAAADLAEAENKKARARISGEDTAEFDKQIEAIRSQTSVLEEGAIALQSFQRAVEDAAASLAETLVGEAKSLAERARREANAAYGENSFDRRDALRNEIESRDRQRQSEDFRRELDNQIRQERLAFEQEILSGDDEATKALLKRVREGRATQANMANSGAAREAARADADAAQAELDRIFERRPGVEAARRRADQEDVDRARRRFAAQQSRDAADTRLSLVEGNRRAAVEMQLDSGSIGAFSELAKIAKQIDETRDALRRAEATESDAGPAIQKRLDELERQAADLLEGAIVASVARAQNKLASGPEQERAALQSLSSAGVFASDIQGRITENEIRRKELIRQRDEAQNAGRDDVAAARQEEINNLDKTSAGLNSTAIALAGFQRAAVEAALALRDQLASEARSTADRARRDANAAEATFGAKSPFAKEARERQKAAEAVADRAEKQKLEADAAIAQERVKFEQELRDRPDSPDAVRADEIRRLEERANNESLGSAEREAARAEADRLKREQEIAFRNRPAVQQAQADADAADADMQRVASANRAIERSMTERQRQEKEAAGIAGDIKNLFDQQPLLGKDQKQEIVDNTFRNEAERVAPMLVGFAEARQNALLQGPSRAALQATDITTSAGANELNRLIRGDDPAREANLVELRKQTNALTRIVDEIKNATGIVATAET